MVCYPVTFLVAQVVLSQYCKYVWLQRKTVIVHFWIHLPRSSIVSRSETVPDWLFEDFYPSFQAITKMLIFKLTSLLILKDYFHKNSVLKSVLFTYYTIQMGANYQSFTFNPS